MTSPRTPKAAATHLRLHVNKINRFIEAGELHAHIHPEALNVFMNSRRTVNPYTGPSVDLMISDLLDCQVVLLAEYMEREGVAGHFFTALAGAMRYADPANLHSLYAAFPKTLHGYLLQQREWAEREGGEKA